MKTVLGKKSRPLGRILVEKNILSQEKLQEILLLQQDSPLRLGQLLIKKGLAAEDDILSALSEQFGLPYIRHLEFKDDDHLLAKLPVHFLKRHRMVPYRVERKNIYIAVSDALNIKPFDDLKILFPEHSLQLILSSESDIQRIINAHFDVLRTENRENVIEDLEESDLEILSSPVLETEDILDMANEAPIIKLVNMIITQAVTDRASDIHIEPYEKDLAVRYRIDGILYQMYTPPKKFQNAVISRIKIMANLNIAENRLPQDGRIQIKIGGKDIDIRVSVFPTYYGERVVLRLLNKSDMQFDLGSLGFSKHVFSLFAQQIQKTYGIILVTGPTGSGKSTTLYSVLTTIKNTDINILTVEDPIEYQLHGIGQMQVKPKIELTFANGLRSILRQDPDVIMIGEIRDLETAEIAVQAALTGHRVFSTLHTNDAASGITRLIDMGIEPFLITSSVNAFLAQRLVRTICPHCKKNYKPGAKMLADLGQTAKKIQKLYRGEGCEKCLNTGYLGRTGIYELLPVTDSIRKMIISRNEAYEIKDHAIREGMKTLFLDGLDKAVEGITTIEEVLRVS